MKTRQHLTQVRGSHSWINKIFNFEQSTKVTYWMLWYFVYLKHHEIHEIKVLHQGVRKKIRTNRKKIGKGYNEKLVK